MALLEVKNLKIYYRINHGVLSRVLGVKSEMVKAVDDLTFDIDEGEIVGIVGETGCGKTTLGKSILLLIKPVEGKIFFEGENILELSGKGIRQFRRQVQIVPQDPVGSLNPRMKIKNAIAEPLRAYNGMYHEKIEETVGNLLKTVDLSPEYGEKYPFQLSGGEARRVTVARSLALHPKLIICDEPTSGLDFSTSAKILNVVKEIHDKFNLTYAWISHNLHEVNYISDRILVMYLGKIVEIGKTSDIFTNPAHPYTQGLLQAVPRFIGRKSLTQKKVHLRGEVPSPINPPPGCRFHPRCAFRMAKCMEVEPMAVTIKEGHKVACCRVLSNSGM